MGRREIGCHDEIELLQQQRALCENQIDKWAVFNSTDESLNQGLLLP